MTLVPAEVTLLWSRAMPLLFQEDAESGIHCHVGLDPHQ